MDRKVIQQLMQTPWKTPDVLTCKLPAAQEDACQQVAMLSDANRAVISEVKPCVLLPARLLAYHAITGNLHF